MDFGSCSRKLAFKGKNGFREVEIMETGWKMKKYIEWRLLRIGKSQEKLIKETENVGKRTNKCNWGVMKRNKETKKDILEERTTKIIKKEEKKILMENWKKMENGKKKNYINKEKRLMTKEKRKNVF